MHAAGLDDTLKAAGPLTIYAPTDEAFAAMPAADRAALMANPERLRSVLLGHVVKDMIKMRDGDAAITSGTVSSAAGRDIVFAVDDRDRTMVGKAHLIRADMRADNGAVNTIDKVLF